MLPCPVTSSPAERCSGEWEEEEEEREVEMDEGGRGGVAAAVPTYMQRR